MVSDRWSVRIKAECGEYDNAIMLCRDVNWLILLELASDMGQLSYWCALNPIVFSRVNVYFVFNVQWFITIISSVHILKAKCKNNIIPSL